MVSILELPASMQRLVLRSVAKGNASAFFEHLRYGKSNLFGFNRELLVKLLKTKFRESV